jgi:hypothetical protein
MSDRCPLFYYTLGPENIAGMTDPHMVCARSARGKCPEGKMCPILEGVRQ